MSAPTKPLYNWTSDEMLADGDAGETRALEALVVGDEPLSFGH